MPLTLDKNQETFYINAYDVEAGKIIVNDQAHEGSLIINQEHLISWAPTTIGEMDVQAIQTLLAQNPKTVLLGTGKEFTFPAIELLAPFYNAQVGIEVMDSAAACRTFNVLMSEGRDVTAAILIK